VWIQKCKQFLCSFCFTSFERSAFSYLWGY